MIHCLKRKFKALRRQPRFNQLWLLPAWLLLGIGRALILALSFQRLAPWLGRPSVAAAVEPPWVDAAQTRRAAEIGSVLQLAARYTPWESNCLAQALAARVLLGLHRIPYLLCFGLQRDAVSAAVNAHAWVMAGPVTVTGGPGHESFSVVGVLVARPRAAR